MIGNSDIVAIPKIPTILQHFRPALFCPPSPAPAPLPSKPSFSALLPPLLSSVVLPSHFLFFGLCVAFSFWVVLPFPPPVGWCSCLPPSLSMVVVSPLLTLGWCRSLLMLGAFSPRPWGWCCCLDLVPLSSFPLWVVLFSLLLLGGAICVASVD